MRKDGFAHINRERSRGTVQRWRNHRHSFPGTRRIQRAPAKRRVDCQDFAVLDGRNGSGLRDVATDDGQIGRDGNDGIRGSVRKAVSYTHLDVYKRQRMDRYRARLNDWY